MKIKLLILLTMTLSLLFGNNLYYKGFMFYKKGNMIYSTNKTEGKKLLAKSLNYFEQLSKIENTKSSVLNFYMGNIITKLYLNKTDKKSINKLKEGINYLDFAYKNGTTKAICPLLDIKIKLNYPALIINSEIKTIQENQQILNYCINNYTNLKKYLK